MPQPTPPLLWGDNGNPALLGRLTDVLCCAVLHYDTGLIGTAPSHELLDIWNKREAELVEAGPEGTTLGGVLHTRPLGKHGLLFLLLLLYPLLLDGPGHVG